MIEGAGDGRITKELLELVAVPADEMTEIGLRTRRAMGLLQWMSPVRLETKLMVHVLSWVMMAPSRWRHRTWCNAWRWRSCGARRMG
jgi:hypothetical protein